MRSLFIGSLAGALAGCSTIDVVPPSLQHPADSLVIAPRVGYMCLGDTAVLRATLASSGAAMRVRWRSDSTRVATVSDSGVVRAASAGMTSISALRLDDTTQRASLVVAVAPDSPVAYTFTSIVASGTSTAVNPTAVHGAIDLVSPVPGHAACLLNPSYDRAELHVRDPNSTRDTIVAVNPAAPIVPATTVRLTFDSGARLPNGAPAFPNGTYMLSVRFIATAVPQRSEMVGPQAVTLANP